MTIGTWYELDDEISTYVMKVCGGWMIRTIYTSGGGVALAFLPDKLHTMKWKIQ